MGEGRKKIRRRKRKRALDPGLAAAESMWRKDGSNRRKIGDGEIAASIDFPQSGLNLGDIAV